MPTVTYTWKSRRDTSTCEKCLDLDGAEWVFNLEEDPDRLAHPIYGMVFDLNNCVSMAHGGGPYRCRCGLDIQFETADLTPKVKDVSLKSGDVLGRVVRYLTSLKDVLKSD